MLLEITIPFFVDHAIHAHWFVLGLFLLAGLNFPISEDLLIILSGVTASTVVPENTWKLFLAVYAGAFLSDWIPYWLGRRFGPNLWRVRWFSKMFKEERLTQIKQYYKKYGVLTLLVGRFIPFGVRNCLFVSAGMGEMSFPKFLISDGIACLISNTVLFTLAYFFGQNSHWKYVNLVLFLSFLIATIAFIWYKRRRVPKEID